MPFYIYECEQGHAEEILRPMGERDDCPSCKECQGETKRVLGKGVLGMRKIRNSHSGATETLRVGQKLHDYMIRGGKASE